MRQTGGGWGARVRACASSSHRPEARALLLDLLAEDGNEPPRPLRVLLRVRACVRVCVRARVRVSSGGGGGGGRAGGVRFY